MLQIGKKGENSYLFTSLFSDESKFKTFCEDGIIKDDNFLRSKDISRDEFDEKNNLKKATTLISYKELQEYIEKHKLK